MRRSLLTTIRVLCFLSLGTMGPAHASDEVAEAEHDRIAGEMEKLATRQVWTGVERRYQELVELGSEMNKEDHVTGAYAARELGDIHGVYQRLLAAIKLGETQELLDWLWAIDRSYGRVTLLSVPARSRELAINTMPFDPIQRRAVETAIEAARQKGGFDGMLPQGDYNFSGQSFSVEPGVAVRVEVSPKVRRQGTIDPVIVYTKDPSTYTLGDTNKKED